MSLIARAQDQAFNDEFGPSTTRLPPLLQATRSRASWGSVVVWGRGISHSTP